MAGPRTLIANALEDLSPEDLTRFTARLKEPRGDQHKPERFRQAQLYGKNPHGLADLLVDSFSGHAVSITVALLRAIDAHWVADNLAAGASAAPAMTGRASGAAAHEGHFVDRHRKELINRVSNVAPILDHLLQEKVLMNEQYHLARAERTPHDKMRFLFSGPMTAAGVKGKDELLFALKEQEPYLIADLEKKEG